ncbi:MAG: hypothetical protein IPP85_16840 [Propionivibrio sp.]|nr:hypothetical protein [Propionivibrio sp.]
MFVTLKASRYWDNFLRCINRQPCFFEEEQKASKLSPMVFLSARVQAMTGFLAKWFEKQRDQAL